MMPRQSLFPIAALVAAALVAGCSSYDRTLNQEIGVRSIPDEAVVTINGKTTSQLTDTDFILKRDGDYVIEISKAGYKPATVRINKRATGETTPGAPQYELDHDIVSVTLEEDPVAKAARDNKEAAEKAEAAGIVAATEAAKVVATSADKVLETAKTAADTDKAAAAVEAAEKASKAAAEAKSDESLAQAAATAAEADAALHASADAVNAAAKTVRAASVAAEKIIVPSDELAGAKSTLLQARARLGEAADTVTALSIRLQSAKDATAGTVAGIKAAAAAAPAPAAIAVTEPAKADVEAEASRKAAEDRARIEAAAREQAARDAAVDVAKNTDAEKIARLEQELATAKTASAKDKTTIADLETKLDQAKDYASRPATPTTPATPVAPTAAPAAPVVPAKSVPTLERYAELRRQLATGEITPTEYKAAVAKLSGN